MDYHFKWAENGNVASLGEVNLPSKKGIYKFYIIYQFSKNSRPAFIQKKDYEIEKDEYKKSWDNYLSGLKKMRGLDQNLENFYFTGVSSNHFIWKIFI